jgi:hypothetical protein
VGGRPRSAEVCTCVDDDADHRVRRMEAPCRGTASSGRWRSKRGAFNRRSTMLKSKKKSRFNSNTRVFENGSALQGDCEQRPARERQRVMCFYYRGPEAGRASFCVHSTVSYRYDTHKRGSCVSGVIRINLGSLCVRGCFVCTRSTPLSMSLWPCSWRLEVVTSKSMATAHI